MIRLLTVALVVMCVCACQRRLVVVPPPPPPPQDVVVLLPDPETRAVGRAVVSSPLGAQAELTTERAATRIVEGRQPTDPFTLMETEVQQLFGEALASRPPAARHFLLYFVSGSNMLTPESETLLTDVLAFIKSRATPDVSVIGHTDTTGIAQANFELGRSRAAAIRDRLVATGLDSSLVSVASHGEADPLMRTADNTPEPRNRRVEVSVR